MSGLRIGIAVTGLLLFSASPGLAAQVDGPVFLASDPEAGTQLKDAPARVQVTFSEPLDPSSQLLVVDECGRLINDGATVITANSMETGLKKAPSGAYTVRYRAKGPGGLSGETSGGFQFVVADGPSCGGRHGDHEPRHGGKHKGGGEGRHESPHYGDGHKGSTDHSNTSHSKGRHSESKDHSSTSHSKGRHSGSKDHSNMAHSKNRRQGKDHPGGSNGKHGSDHESSEDESSPASTTLAAPEVRLGVEGSAVAIALGAALLLGTAGGWLIRTKKLFL